MIIIIIGNDILHIEIGNIVPNNTMAELNQGPLGRDPGNYDFLDPNLVHNFHKADILNLPSSCTLTNNKQYFWCLMQFIFNIFLNFYHRICGT